MVPNPLLPKPQNVLALTQGLFLLPLTILTGCAMAVAYTECLKKPAEQWYEIMLATDNVPCYLANLLRSMRDRHHPGTFGHLLLVGRLCYYMGQLTGNEIPNFWLAGLGHDIGKLGIPASLLDEKNWCRAKDAIMRPHVMNGYNALVEKLPFIAHIIVRHHRFQLDPYPEELPALPEKYARLEEKINWLAKMVAIADCYDALHRDNDRNGLLNGHQIQKKMLVLWPNDKPFIGELYAAGIFTTDG